MRWGTCWAERGPELEERDGFHTVVLSLCMDMEDGLRYLMLSGLAVKAVLLGGMLLGWVRRRRG
jgi:hypothetical protein